MWSPIIEASKDKKKINDIIDKIFFVLAKNVQTINPFDVYMGKSGIYLFLLFYKFRKNQQTKELDCLFESIVESASHCEISNFQKLTHYAEMAWLACFLYKKNIVDFDLNDFFSEIDGILYEGMISLLKEKEYGLVNGATSIGLYFYYRYTLGSDYVADFLKKFVDCLSEISIEKENTIEWINIIDYGSYTKGHNLGIAHGIPGIILFLQKLYRLGIEKERIADILTKATNFLFIQKHSLETHKSYFYNISSDSPQIGIDSRLAWCYGDLSVAYALYKATSIDGIGSSGIKKEVIEILSNTTRRISLQETGVIDAGLCHGTSGLAHIYNRLYHQTGMLEFKKASLYWYKETLKMPKYENEYVGFGIPYYLAAEEHEINRQYNLSFLTGIAGIGLSLLSSICCVEPEWDQYLMLS